MQPMIAGVVGREVSGLSFGIIVVALLGIDGGLYQAEDSNDRPGVRLYAKVDDAQAFLEKAASLGDTVVGEAQEVPGQGIKVGQFLNPEGNVFGVVQPLQG